MATDAALAGIVFNVLLIVRAPLQLFQAVQTSLLPHLSGLAATGGDAELRGAVRTTVLAIAAFTAAVVLGLGLIGPWAMDVLFGGEFDYGRGGLMLVGLGMGLHLAANTLNQAALARGRGHAAAARLARRCGAVPALAPRRPARRRAARGRARLCRHHRPACRRAVADRA